MLYLIRTSSIFWGLTDGGSRTQVFYGFTL